MAVVAALIVVSPVAVVGYGQLHQIHWLKPPGLGSVLSVQRIVGQSSWLFLLTVVICLAGVAVSASAGRSRLPRDWPAGLIALCLPWLVLPPVILLTASLAHPVYTYRYIVYCIPAAALLIGAAVAALGRYAGPVALVLILVAGLHIQLAQRRADGHGINIRAADHLVARHAEPGTRCSTSARRAARGKASGERLLERAYPYGLARLRDVSAGVSPQQSAHPRRHVRVRLGDPAAAGRGQAALGRGVDDAPAGAGPARPGLHAGPQLGHEGPAAAAVRRARPVLVTAGPSPRVPRPPAQP